jgi:hypothetical protein
VAAREGGFVILREFIAELRTIQDRFVWKFESDFNRPGERRSRTRLRIRAVLDETADAPLFDPIGAVCFAKTGLLFDAESWIEAANAIELSLIDAADITATTNDRTWKADAVGRVQDPYLVSLRECLMNIVGLNSVNSRKFRW